MSPNTRFRVTAELGLNLRSAPVVSNANKLAVLPHGHTVTKLADVDAKWAEVETKLQGVAVGGFVSKNYLTPADVFTPTASVAGIKEVHLASSNPVRRNQTGGRAFPLNEANQKTRNAAGTAAEKAGQLGNVIKWLQVETSARYGPTSSHTYCNIYAYDYCYLAGAYLPRVWWSSSALLKLKAEQHVEPSYGHTVNELNANSLFNWFREFGATFGWERAFDLTDLQDEANAGKVVIATGPNKNPNKSGHICAIVPETGAHKAARSGATVTTPLQSQAGASNHAYWTWKWWTLSYIREVAFYVHS